MRSNVLHKLPFLGVHQRTFELIRDGKKKLETRAGSPEYLKIVAGDKIEFSCGGAKVIKRVKRVVHYLTLEDLFVVYRPEEINPEVSSQEELKKTFMNFPGYKNRIKEHGILVFELTGI